MAKIEMTVKGVDFRVEGEDGIKSVLRVFNLLPVEDTKAVELPPVTKISIGDEDGPKPVATESVKPTVVRPVPIETRREDLGPFTHWILGRVKENGRIGMAEIVKKAGLANAQSAGYIVNRLRTDLQRFGYLDGEVVVKTTSPSGKEYLAGPKFLAAYESVNAVVGTEPEEEDQGLF